MPSGAVGSIARNGRRTSMVSSRRRRLTRELVPALIGVGAVALITVSASQQALGVVITDHPTSTCSLHSTRLAPDCGRPTDVPGSRTPR